MTALKETDARFRALITPPRAATSISFGMENTNVATVSPSAATGSPQGLTVDGKTLDETALHARLNGDVCESMSVNVEEQKWKLSSRRVKKEEEEKTSINSDERVRSLSATGKGEDDEEEYTDIADGDTLDVCPGDTAKFKCWAAGGWFGSLLGFSFDVEWDGATETKENDSEVWSKAQNSWSTPGAYEATATCTGTALWFIPINDLSLTQKVHVVDVTFDSLESPICAATADHEAGTSLAEASITPSKDRDLKWELMDNDIDASIDSHGTTAIITAKSEGGTVIARVCDSVLTSCTAVTKELTVVDVSLDSLSPTTICAASTGQEGGTALATASVTPSGRALEWKLMDNDIGASIDENGTNARITAGTDAGTVNVRVCDTVLTSCTAAKSTCVVIPSEYFTKHEDEVMWYPERNYDMTDHLVSDIDSGELVWTIEGDGSPSIDSNGMVEFGDETATKYTITVRHELDEDGDCAETFNLTAAGYKVSIDDEDEKVFDGKHVSVVLKVAPTDLDQELLDEIKSISCRTKPKQDSKGNPAGTTDFDCDGLGDDYTTNLGPALWYSTQEDHCNDSSKYELKMEATIQDHTVEPVNTDNPEFVVYVELGVNKAIKTQTWNEDNAGKVITPDFLAEEKDDGTWKVTVEKEGKFGRDVQAYPYIGMDEDSQFYKMVKEEEEFHEGQYEGTTSRILDHLWDPDEIMQILEESEPYTGGTKKEAVDAARQKFKKAIIKITT